MSRAPAFRTLWDAARARARERAVRRRRLAAGAAVAAGVLLLATLLAEPRAPEPDLHEIALLSARVESWQGPLDFLLETPGRGRLEDLPAFGSPLSEERWGASADLEERT